MATQVKYAQLTVCECAMLPTLSILVTYEDWLKGPMELFKECMSCPCPTLGMTVLYIKLKEIYNRDNEHNSTALLQYIE